MLCFRWDRDYRFAQTSLQDMQDLVMKSQSCLYRGILQFEIPLPTSLLHILSENLTGWDALPCIGSGEHRMTHRVQGTDLVIKGGKSLLPFAMQFECIRYEISELLKFGVVPFTQYIPPDSDESKLIEERCPGAKSIAVQRYIAPASVPINIEHAHKVIFFSWITGRSDDAKRANSIVDAYGKVWEIDNKQNPTSRANLSHWLLKEPGMEAPINSELLEWILKLPDQITLNRENGPKQFQEKWVIPHEKLIRRILKQ